MDYYQILGVNENASQDEIRSAYKKLAMKNHPDRGGDTKRFQEISQAYDTLSDDNKRQEYDASRHGFNQFNGHNPFGGIHDIFSFTFGQGFANFQQQGMRRNKDLTIRIGITLRQSFTGTQIEAKYNSINGKSNNIVIDIPAGIATGQTIRYQGLGDDSIPNVPRGNLNVTVIVEEDPRFSRMNADLHSYLDLNLMEAMTGCKKDFFHIDGTILPIQIRPGVTNGTEFCANGRGFRMANGAGNLYIKLHVKIPAITDPTLIKEMESLYARISKTP